MNKETKPNQPKDISIPIEIRSFDGKISLRQYTPQDVDELFSLLYRNKDFLSQNNEDTGRKYQTPESLLDSIVRPVNPARLRLAIRNEDGTIVGGINLTPDPDKSDQAEIGYWLGEEFNGKGYAGRAVTALTAFGFEQKGYTAIYGKVFEANDKSMAVLRRAGYQETIKDDEGYIKFVIQKS